MTIAELIRTVDRLRPNAYQWDQKVGWIAEVEDQIYEEIVLTHENQTRIARPRIDKNADPDHKLIAPAPYDVLYQYWLFSKIDFNNMEIGKYNNDSLLYNNAMLSFRDYWNRWHMAVERVPHLIFDNRRRMPRYDGRPLHSMGDPLNMGAAPVMRPHAGPVPVGPVEKEEDVRHLHDDIMDIRAKNRKQDKQIEEIVEGVSGAGTGVALSVADVEALLT